MSVIDVVMKLTDQVTGPLLRIKSQMDRTAAANARLSRSMKNIGRDVGNIGKAMLPLAGTIAAAGAASAKAFVGFDATITAAGAKAGATAEEMQRMRETAANLGAKFPVSASQVAQSMDALAASGFNANQTIGVMPSILTAAVASGEDLATTSTIVTSALNVWNLTQGDVGKNASRVADVIQQAANASSMGMQDFGTALQYAGAPAAALKVNIEDLSTALALIKNKGIDASTAGTSLRSLFTRLASPPKAAAVAIEQLGLKTQDAQGNFVGLENVIGQMRTAMQGMNDTQRIALAQSIAGTEGYSALLALVDTSAESYSKMSGAMNNASGSSAKQFQIMQNTVKGSIDAMMGSVESLAINFGDIMAPAMKSAAASIAGIANWLNQLSPEQKKLVANLALGIVGMTGFFLAAGKVITIGGSLIGLYGSINTVLAGNHIKNKALEYAIIGVSKAFGVLRTAMAGALGPIGLIIMAVAAVAYVIYRNWGSIAPYFNSVWDTIKSVIHSGIDAFNGLLDFITGVFTGNWSMAWQGVVNIFSGIFSGLSTILGGYLSGIRYMINSVIDGINGISVDVPSWVPGIGGKKFGPLNIPHLYTGANDWRGGNAVINDRYGGEIVDLPNGTRVMPHDQSVNQAYNMGRTAATAPNISVSISGVTINNDNDVERLAHKVAEQIYWQMQKRAINMKVGAV